MDATSLKTFKAILTNRRAELLARLARVEHEGRATAKADPADFGDQSIQTFDREFLFAQADANRRMIGMIQAALLRIQEGTFGECTRCGAEISVSRLKAIPWARCCLGCQEGIERHRQPAAA